MTDKKALQVDRALGRYGSDLWYTRRLNLREIEDNLKNLINARDGANDQKTVQDQIKFIQFLESECSGRGFSSDKQWGRLMNLMQISRKLNHKSVRFRDILANKSLIEACAGDIKQFNESIRHGTLIEQLINDLELGIQTSQMLIISWTSVPGHESEDVDARVLDEIIKSQKHLETSLMPSLHSIRSHLQNELVALDNPEQSREWTSQSNKFTIIVDKLKGFLDRYYTLKRDLIQLKPLISGIIDRDNQQAGSTTPANQNSQLLVNSLRDCKSVFMKLLDYNDSLEQSMKDLSRKSLRTSRPSSTKVANDQEILKLNDLLNRTTLAYVDDIYDSDLSKALKMLKDCCQSLDRVMSTLRLEFGRFYFVNDLELLMIISLDSRLVENCDQLSNQRLIVKLFNNSMEKFILRFDEQLDQTHIIGVKNSAGEEIMLAGQDPVPLRKKVNIYSLEIVRILNELTRKLQRSLRTTLTESLKNQEDIDWSLPIQIMSLAEQIKFTLRVESTFDIQKILAYYERRLRLLGNTKESWDEQSNGNTLKNSEAISLTVHFISILMELSRWGVCSVNDWPWQKLARYYQCQDTEEVRVCLANSQFLYKFDLVPIELSSGSAGHEISVKRLVYTKTSERCFLVASQAIGRLKLGASPFGPAGSGKTETVKALGRMLGCRVIVHNCDETNDARSLERLIWGLAHTGLWGCFDEFNRLSADTLSSVSAVLEIVQSSLRLNRTTLELEGGEIRSIDQDSAFFITMNPGDSNKYQGRRRLPANLRSLFLPIAMVNVQIDSIVCEMLLAHGSTTHNNRQLRLPIEASSAAELGRKLSRWTVWMRSNLRTSRCEWDLRLVMVILKRFKMTPLDAGEDKSLDCIVVNSIVTEVVHRLSPALGEVDILARSFKEIFNYEIADISNTDFRLEAQLKQLESQLEVRPGVILLDSHRSGRSHKLWRALVSRDEHIEWFALNPKSCDKDALFGIFKDVQDATHTGQIQPTKWMDGLFTHLVRKSLKLLECTQTHQVWIILDGSLDPDWIESLNSVLDDNQVLTLSSGERLNFVLPHSRKCIKLIFLTDQIAHVSPATISRLGLINFERVEITGDEDENLKMKFHTITTTIVNPEQVVNTADQITAIMEIPAGQFDYIEYNCSELSTSYHLLDVLDSTRFLRGENKFVVIHNLNSIKLDKWQTNTFVELLKFAVTYGFYYDPDHNIRQLTGYIRFNLTVTDDDGIFDKILRSMNSETFDLRDQSSFAEMPISKDALISMVSSAHHVGIELVHVEDGQTQRVLNLIQCSIMSDSITEIFTFDCSTGVTRSLEKLHEISQRTHAKMASANHKRCVFILDSLQLSLMDVKSRANLCHLLNLVKFAQIGISFFILLDCYDVTKSVCDHFWLSMADKKTLLAMPKYDERYLQGYLSEEKPDERLPGILANFSKKYKITDNFLATLERMIAKTKAYLGSKKEMLTNSLNRLEQLEKNIETHKIAKIKEERDLAEMGAQIEIRSAQMFKELEESKKRSDQIDSLKHSQEQKTQQMERNKVNMQKELRDVLPAIERSKTEVSRCLKPEALNEIKTLRSPPKTVEDILSVLFVILGHDSTSWSSIKTHLAKQSLRDEMTNYDFQARLNENLLQKIEREISARNESFQIERASRASTAIVPMLNWIQAARQYGRALIKLLPLTDGMRKLEAESEELAKTMRELAKEQAVLNERVAEDKRELNRLDDSFRSTKEGLCRLRHDLDRAQIVIGDLSHQLGDWRSQVLGCDKLSCNNWQRLYDLCLVCSSIACYACDHDSLNQLLRDWSDILGQHEESLRDSNVFLRNQLSTIIECVDEESALELRLYTPDRDGAGPSLDQLVKVLLIKLNLLFNQDTIPYLKVDTSLTSAELAQYLAFKRIICADQNHLVHIDATACDWQRKADSIMQMNNIILLLNTTASSLCAPQLDILNYISTRDNSKLPRKIILVDQSQKPCPLEMSRLTRVVEVNSRASIISDSKLFEAKIIDEMIELREPTINSDIRKLEADLRDKQRQVRKLESNLVRSLMVSSMSAQATAPHSELVNLLSGLRQSGLDLSSSIDKIMHKLDELRSRRKKFETLARKAADYYARNLSTLGQVDSFYHMSIEKYARLVLNSTKALQIQEDIDWSQILTTAMWPMRPAHRDAFCGQLAANEASLAGQEAAMSALKQAANLRSTLSALLESTASDDTNLSTCKIAIIQHESTKSGPQLEIEELMRSRTKEGAQRSQTWDYQVLCATKNGPLLQAQLDETLSKHRKAGNRRHCICIANAHLASQWLSDRLPQMTKAISAGHLLLILVGESPDCQSGCGSQTSARVDSHSDDDQAHFGSNLLDAVDLKYWYDELALKLLDRFTLYEHRIMSKQKDVTLRDITRELVLFHVVCQELTKARVDSSGSEGGTSCSARTSWQHGDKYNFDYGQLSLAHTILQQIRADKLAAAASSPANQASVGDVRESLCHYLSTIVYGSRLETQADEELLERLLNKFLRKHDMASCQIATLDKLLSGLVAAQSREQQQLVDDLIAVPNL